MGPETGTACPQVWTSKVCFAYGHKVAPYKAALLGSHPCSSLYHLLQEQFGNPQGRIGWAKQSCQNGKRTLVGTPTWLSRSEPAGAPREKFGRLGSEPKTCLTLDGEQTFNFWQLSGGFPLNHNQQKCKMFPNNHQDDNELE